MKMLYYIAERFYPTKAYNDFSVVKDRFEIVTMDILLCVPQSNQFVYDAFAVTRKELLDMKNVVNGYQVIRYIKNPDKELCNQMLDEYEFVGYDLIKEDGNISAVTNCGPLENIHFEKKLNKYGLIEYFDDVKLLQCLLMERFPEDEHATCDIYAVWRFIPNI